MADELTTNKWKFATIVLLIVGATALITSIVIGRDTKVMAPEEIVQSKEIDTQTVKKESESKPEPEVKVAAAPPAPMPSAKVTTASTPLPAAPSPKIAASPTQPVYPPQSVIDACNKYASEQVNSKTTEVVKGAGIGALLGAATGAAVGAIAGGGKGAAKGAGIGAIGGGVGGTLYGLNENQTNDARYQEAYASCMRSRGF